MKDAGAMSPDTASISPSSPGSAAPAAAPPSVHDWSAPVIRLDRRFLRLTTAAALLPAFPLCVAHAAVSRRPVLGLGLIPLAHSAALGAFLAVRYGRCRRQAESTLPGDGCEEQWERAAGERLHAGGEDRSAVLLFVADAALAASLAAVLGVAWADVFSYRYYGGHGPQAAMLAGYATLPLLVSLVIHSFFALRVASIWLGRWIKSRAVPTECAHCGHLVRPMHAVTVPQTQQNSQGQQQVQTQQQMGYSLAGFWGRDGLTGGIALPRWARGGEVEDRTEAAEPLLVEGQPGPLLGHRFSDDENQSNNGDESGAPAATREVDFAKAEGGAGAE